MSLSFRIDHRPQIDSTNLEAMRQARLGATPGLVVLADSQTAGRGRHGRSWQSYLGNLLVSILVRPDIAPCRLGELAFVTALAVADTVDQFLATEKALLKWPNDVLVEGAKLAGILIENDLNEDELAWSVVGIGINIVSAPDDTPYRATSLHQQGAICSRRDDVLTALLSRFSGRWDQWHADGFAAIRDDWMARAWMLGKPIAVETDSAHLMGQFDGIDDNGALLLETEQGQRRVNSGSLSYRQTA